MYMTDGDLNIYTDFPYKSGAYGYMEYDAAELDSIAENSLFIFTHKHADHYSKKNLKKVLKAKKGTKFGPWNASKLVKHAETIPNFSIETFKTKHRLSFNHYSYLITWHGKRIFLSGDTETAETLSKIPNIDLAFVPAWVLSDAHRNNLRIDAQQFAIYHLYPDQKINLENPDRIKLMDKQGEVINLKYE